MVVDDHAQVRQSMIDILGHAGHRVDGVSSALEGLNRLKHESYDVVITDLRMPGMSGLEFIRALEQMPHGAQVVMVTAHATVSSAVEAMRHGAFDYIEKPFDADQLESLVQRASRHGQLLDSGPSISESNPSANGVVMLGHSPAMERLRSQIAQAAPTSETVLITGESGTGKELVARSLHQASDRADSPFVGLNCPVLSAQLLESELFGHEQGSFTGADRQRTGRFELAASGTILLDEVTEIELPLQAKLLRVLQERAFERVGSGMSIPLEARVIATTNRNLQDEVRHGTFREDLYFRLAVLPLNVPPLRARREDVPELVEHYLQAAAQRLHQDPLSLSADAQELLIGYHWPGNVRELENLVTRLAVLCTSSAVTADEVRPWLIDASGENVSEDEGQVPLGLSLQEMEQKMIEATLEHYDGHRGKTAKALGIGLRTLTGKLRAYGYAPRAKVPAKAA
jgi:DNA-binding NtrC family response regulator